MTAQDPHRANLADKLLSSASELAQVVVVNAPGMEVSIYTETGVNAALDRTLQGYLSFLNSVPAAVTTSK
eukprot:CAMPEP_0184321332 /NCGR_PEP_ID=MMETSP1049-20130417/118378_1 /TAXON_ID=77928 /ORGANISM="Proteomonas sulcata, Strain CCMP704" /LENGTH=69 /DNA_ID=CAMNT_0026642093 /DNA_START=239 /DNA_END=448 /DNA_ORIENTATION=-